MPFTIVYYYVTAALLDIPWYANWRIRQMIKKENKK